MIHAAMNTGEELAFCRHAHCTSHTALEVWSYRVALAVITWSAEHYDVRRDVTSSGSARFYVRVTNVDQQSCDDLKRAYYIMSVSGFRRA